MPPQTSHTTREDALISADQMAQASTTGKASVWYFPPDRWVATEYLPGDELQGNAVIVRAGIRQAA